MPDKTLCYMPANEAIRRFKDHSLSPVELLHAYIERDEAISSSVNAFTFRYFDEALEQARESEKKYLSGEETAPLEGLPVAVKDESEIAGMPTSNGSLTMKDYVPSSTSIVNQRVLDAGAIVHARTATPEFSCAGYCHSKLWGVTRNPWNTEFTPGGSSGGSGASLAAGTCSLATGSDIGGSIRIPASASGVVGFKPPYGRNPQESPFNLDFYCHSGPLARSVADSALLQNVMAGPSTYDIASLKPKLEVSAENDDIKGWSIAYSRNLGYYEVEPEVEKNMLAALDVFRDLGATVVEVDLPWDEHCLEAGLAYLEHIFGASIAPLLGDHADELTDYARVFAEKGQSSTSMAFFKSLEVAGAMYNDFGPMMEKHQLFVCPTNNLAAVKAEHNQAVDKVVINGKEVDPMLGWVMTLPFNMLSRCPVMSVPSGFRRDGVPTGIQLVGGAYQDQDVFRAAAAFEHAVGRWYVSEGKRPKI